MKKRSLLLTAVLTVAMATATIAQTKPDIDKVDNAVVIVMIYDYKGNQVGHGSGFLIDDKGTVVTNYHVVKGASSLKVKIDNNGYREVYDVGNIISGDASKDLAKISLKNPSSKIFPFLTVSKTFPTKGEDCWAIGTPADEKYMNTVSKGLISNIDQYSTPKMLQTNAEITHGSSGGALINSKGEVIGVTSAGDGTEDGARASINFAIWIGELNNLPPINKQSVVDPASIPCQLGFYTNSPYSGYVYFYIDGIYVGSFSKYFQNNYSPTCGEDGTITRYLYAGSHTYQVYYATTDQWYYGTITLNPGQCQMFRVGGDTPTQTYYPNYYYSYDNPLMSLFKRKEINDRGDKNWIVASGLAVASGGIPIPIFLEKYINDKFSIRGNLLYYSKKKENLPYSTSIKFFGLGLDLKKIFLRPYRWNWFLSATLNYRFANSKGVRAEQVITNSFNNTHSTVPVPFNDKKNHSFVGLRFGGDRYTSSRFYITLDYAIGYNSYEKEIMPEMNLLLGYRFKTGSK